jgi:squalene-hopene/tetraprenyl-beta-curcumene cyclase
MREPDGHWEGQLCSSALSTATSVSALSLVERHDPTDAQSGRFADESRESLLSELIVCGLRWLAEHQNADGGWGDTDLSHSNISTTMLAVAAFHLTGVPARHEGLLERATRYIETQGGAAGLRKRYGKDKTFAVPILTNYALAGLASWKEVQPLPFELACLPQSLYRWLRLPVVSYAIPALVAVGQARFYHRRPFNPFVWLWRKAAVERSLRVLQHMQPASGGYLEAIPLTSFVVMCLAATGRGSHGVTQKGVEFLLSTVRPDGSWPIDTNLATWNTTLAINALAESSDEPMRDSDCCDWLLRCQNNEVHPFTGACPGGWGWSDLSGAVPDADDTAGALLALSKWRGRRPEGQQPNETICAAAERGATWLLQLQNSDGGWPTFCRGWGKLPFDRSGSDLTAHAIRALAAWQDRLDPRRVTPAISRGLAYLAREQDSDGSWIPLWFGNQDHPAEENRVYGTAKVLFAYRDLGGLDTEQARRGLEWLRRAQNVDGGWGSGSFTDTAGSSHPSSVEETALGLEAVLSRPSHSSLQVTIEKGLHWIVRTVEADHHADPSPIGFYFAKLWYYEKMYPFSFTASALREAIDVFIPTAKRVAALAHQSHG